MGLDYSLHIWCRIRIWFNKDIMRGAGLQKQDFVSLLKQETSPCIWDSRSGTQACHSIRQACSFPPTPTPHNVQKADVHGGSLIIHTWKNAIEASQRAQRTSKATLNPKLYFSHGSSQENKQGLDASVSKILFTLLWWRALKRVLLCSVIGLRAKEDWAQDELCSYRPGFWCLW